MKDGGKNTALFNDATAGLDKYFEFRFAEKIQNRKKIRNSNRTNDSTPLQKLT